MENPKIPSFNKEVVDFFIFYLRRRPIEVSVRKVD
jgi:hypothetical protein